MTYEAAIAILPATSLERLNDPAWLTPDRLMADASGIKLLPRREPAALLVDHDKQRAIGSVKSLMRLDAADPAGKWVVAIVEVTERPDWLRRGTPASPALIISRMCSFGNPILRSAYVTEVSLLSPGLEPAEPDAKVLYVKPKEEKPPPKATAPPAVIRRATRTRMTPEDEMAEFQRRLDWAGPNADPETIIINLREELGYSTSGLERDWRRHIARRSR